MDGTNKVFHRSLFLDGPAGRLEALLWTSTRANPPMAGLVCHPHPLYGGTMHNKVVFQAAKSLHGAGLPVLRFNFRGAGLSQGTHDRGRGERDDVRTALDFLSGEFPGLAVVLAGFSFGSWVGLRVGAEDARVSRLIGIGTPVNDSDFSYLQGSTKAKLFVVGTEDQFAARERVEALVDSLAEPKRLVLVEGAGHFFNGKLDRLGRAIAEWMEEQNARQEKA
ncbi:MAG TPA: alpha/beta family hydrolase [Candidatus Acidoferrales bacterium]|nr:alpha/beta family hydrolase [Candidatus Acidoferrales bacterium]